VLGFEEESIIEYFQIRRHSPDLIVVSTTQGDPLGIFSLANINRRNTYCLTGIRKENHNLQMVTYFYLIRGKAMAIN
jgi:hypothetical protein